MKFIRSVLMLLLAVIIGFWLATADILDGTKAGEVMENVVSYLPDRNYLNQLFDGAKLNDSPQMEVANQVHVADPQDSSIFEESAIDSDLIESTVVELVNELREEQGVGSVASNEMLRAAATIRAVETEESFAHTRPDGRDPFTVFQEEGISYPYQMAGENLGMATYYMEEVEMATLLFDGWVESEGHYENMIQPDYEEIGVGVHFDGEILYVTQLFGTQK